MKLRVDTYKGKLTMLGNSRNRARGALYTMIEIGGRTIEDVFCTDKMDNYLQRGLNHADEVELYIAAKPSYWAAVLGLMKTHILLAGGLLLLTIITGIFHMGGVVGGAAILTFGAIVNLFIQTKRNLSAAHNRSNAIVGMTLDGQLYGNKTI
jgi:hypothetical protein